MIVLTRFILAAIAAAACALAGTELRYRLDPTVLVMQTDPVRLAQELADQSRWAEAKMLSDFVVAHPALGDARQAAALSAQMETELNSFWGTVRRFSHGAATGEPTDIASMLGSLTLDLFVIGDIRDLAVQSWRQVSDGNGDKVILALSAVGLLTTLAPELDWAPAMAKAFKRTGAFSSRFTRSATRTADYALTTGDYSKIVKVVDDLGSAARQLGPGPLSGVMRHIDSTDELAKLSRAAQLNATDTYGVIRLFGRSGVKRMAKDGSNTRALVGAIKISGRATKMARKVTHAVPTPGLLIWLLISLLVLYLAIRPRHPRRPRKPKTSPAPHAERHEPTLRPSLHEAEPAPALPDRRAGPSLSASNVPMR